MNELDVGDAIESATGKMGVVRGNKLACGAGRRTDVETSGDGLALGCICDLSASAGRGEDVGDSRCDSGRGQDFRHYASGPRIDDQLPELRRFHPGTSGSVQVGAAKAFIREEEKQLVLPNWTAQAPAELPEIGVYAGG